MGPSVVTSSLLAVALVTAACGSRWPQHASVASDPVRQQPVRTIDLLPTDLEVWTHPDGTGDPGQIRLAAEARLVGVVSETVYTRGYAVGAVVDWEGRYVGPDGVSQVALQQPQLLATIDSLASYGTIVGNSQSLPDPILPARLGASGADATLYVGGWGFAGKEPEHGKLAGKIIVGTILVAAIVIIAIALSKSKADPLGKVAGSARAVGRAGASMGRTAMRAGSAIVQTTAKTLDAVEPLIEPAIEVAVAHAPQRPVWSSDKTLPRTGRPKMYLEMTLIDNRSGRVLWHAHQAFPANPARPHDVMKAAKLLLASLPPP